MPSFLPLIFLSDELQSVYWFLHCVAVAFFKGFWESKVQVCLKWCHISFRIGDVSLSFTRGEFCFCVVDAVRAGNLDSWACLISLCLTLF